MNMYRKDVTRRLLGFRGPVNGRYEVFEIKRLNPSNPQYPSRTYERTIAWFMSLDDVFTFQTGERAETDGD